MKYIDRKGNVYTEDTAQDRFLRFLYRQKAGRLCLSALIQPAVTRSGGIFLKSSVSRLLIPGFIRRNHIDMSQYEPEKYHSYNDFFIRRIKSGRRPVSEGKDVLTSPCDGKVSVYRIESGRTFLIKGRRYSLPELLKNRVLADRYAGGYLVLLRLTVDDYHHYCYPADGLKSRQVRIPGVYHTVNPCANEERPVYTENAREFCLIRTENMGTILQMEVGALMVGKIRNLSAESTFVQKGEEKGYFEFGGSSIILLLQENAVKPDTDLLIYTADGYETFIKMGEQIGKSKLSERTGQTH